MTKYTTLYEIREYVENRWYSKNLGSKLRNKQRINRILKRLKHQNRDFVVIPWKINEVIKPKVKSAYQYDDKNGIFFKG